MSQKTYFAHLDTLVGNPAAIDREKERLNRAIADISSELRRRLTPQSVPGLIWHLAIKEIDRVSSLVGISVSDFAGQARYLRALCAAVPITTAEATADPQTDELLGICDQLWWALFHREMIDDLKLVGHDDIERHREQVAAMTSLLGAVQGELAYIEQVEERVRAVFGPFAREIIEPQLGLSTDHILTGFRVVRELIPERLRRMEELTRPAYDLWQEFRRASLAGASGTQLDRLVYQHPRYSETGQQFAEGASASAKLLLFGPADLTLELGNRASAFFDCFSFEPGSANLELELPYDEDVVRIRPFARIAQDKFLLFDPCYCSFAPQYRLRQCFNTPRRLERLNHRRDRNLEDDAASLLAPVVQPGLELRSYYLPVAKDGTLAERDLLMLRDGCVLIVESKAKPLRPPKGRRDKLVRIATDVKESIQAGYDQACSVIRYLRSIEGEVSVFDSDKADTRDVETIDTTGIREYIPIVLLDTYYGLIGTDLGPWLSVDPSIGYPWVVDRNTLESILLKIDTFEKFRRFLLWRRNLHGVAVNEDEAVFAGFFVRHGAAKIPDGASRIQLDANYSDIFEAEYFRRKGIPVEMPPEECGPPVWSSMKREGNQIRFEINGKLHDVINIHGDENRKRKKGGQRAGNSARIGRNELCPCGSGLKFKRCCWRSS